MPLHLIKLAVGIDDIEHLRRVRAARAAERGGGWVYTRNHPRRATEVLAGGSIYWVIRGQIRVRQLVTGFRNERDENGRRYCLIEVDPDLGADPIAIVPAVSGLALSGAGGGAARSRDGRRAAAARSHARRAARAGADLIW